MSDVTVIVKQRGAEDAARQIKGMGDAAEKSSGPVGKLGGALSDVGKIAGGFVVAQGLLKLPGFLSDAAKAAAEDEQSTARLSATIKSLGGDFDSQNAKVQDAIKHGQSLAFTDDEVRDSFDKLAQATGDTDEALKRQALAMDLARGANIPLADASKLLGKVTDENLQVFKRMGITLPDVANEADVLAAVQAKFAGQSAAYANSTAGQFEQTKIRMGELKESIGAQLLPVMAKLGDVLLSDVIPKMEQFAGWWAANVQPKIGAFIAWVKPKLAEFGEEVQVQFAKFQVYYDSDIAPAVENIKTAIIAVVTVLKDHWSQIEPFVRPIFIAIETAMMVLQNGIKLILDVISGDWEGAWNDIKALVAGILDGIIALAEAFKDQMAAVFTAAKDAIMGIDWWQVGADIIKWAAQGLKDTAGSIISAAADIARAVGEKLNPKNWKGSPIGIQNWYPHYFSMGMANLAAEAETNPDIQRVREILTQRLGAATVGKNIASPTVDANGNWTALPPWAGMSTIPSASNLVNQYIGGGRFGLVPQFGVSQLDKYGSTFVTGSSQSFDPSLPNYVPSAIDNRTPSYIGGFAHGSDFVPKDGLAYLHKGEAVVPAAENRRGEQSITINLVVDGQVLARVVNLTNARAGV